MSLQANCAVMAKKKNEPNAPLPRPAIDWHSGEEVVGRYANNLVVQYGEHECILSFFELRPPYLLGSHEENLEKLKSLKTIRAECVSRVIIPIGKVPSFLDAIRNSYEKRMQGKGEFVEVEINEKSEEK